MKKYIMTGLILGMSATSIFLTTTVAADEMADRVALLEQQLAELKAAISSQANSRQASSSPAQPSAASSSDTKLQIGGFIKVDAMLNDYANGPRPGNIGDEILVPSTVPVGGEGEGAQFDSHIKTSRLFVKTTTNTDAGVIKSHLELDLLTAAGDERVSNSATSRVRHAYLAWDYSDKGNLLVGQSWSTFFNVGALPESVEFIGPTSGTIFNRQNQIRWTKKAGSGSLMLALENPSTSLSDAGSGIAASNYDDNSMPDVVVRLNGVSGNLSWTAAALAREIAYVDGTTDVSDTGLGFNLSGKLAFDNGDDIKASISSGNLGRYIALNAFRDGGIDATGNLDLTSVTGGYVAFKHKWNDKLRSTIQYAQTTADLANGLATSNTEKVTNLNVNLMYSPTSKLTFGGAYINATRDLEDGSSGEFDRLQLMAKFSF